MVVIVRTVRGLNLKSVVGCGKVGLYKPMTVVRLTSVDVGSNPTSSFVLTYKIWSSRVQPAQLFMCGLPDND